MLSDRFEMAQDMVRQTGLYYEQMSSSILASSRRTWEQEITLAESQRLRDPAAMDILGARTTENTTDSGPGQSSLAGPQGPGPKWLLLALSIEAQQYALLYFDRCTIY